MSLATVLEQIKVAKPHAEEDAETGPIETLSGRRGRKNQAIEAMKRLRREYRQALLDSAVYIITTGEKASAFASAAVENFKCFSTNPNSIYEDLANRIPERLYLGQESVSFLFDTLGRHLEDKAAELDIVGYPQLIFKQQYRITIKNKQDLIELVKTAINEQVGSEIVGINAVQSLIEPAIKAEHSGKTTPIILTADTEKFALDLYSTLGRLHPKGVFLVVAGKGTKTLRATDGVLSVKDPTNETVEQTLKSITISLKR